MKHIVMSYMSFFIKNKQSTFDFRSKISINELKCNKG